MTVKLDSTKDGDINDLARRLRLANLENTVLRDVTEKISLELEQLREFASTESAVNKTSHSDCGIQTDGIVSRENLTQTEEVIVNSGSNNIEGNSNTNEKGEDCNAIIEENSADSSSFNIDSKESKESKENNNPHPVGNDVILASSKHLEASLQAEVETLRVKSINLRIENNSNKGAKDFYSELFNMCMLEKNGPSKLGAPAKSLNKAAKSILITDI